MPEKTTTSGEGPFCRHYIGKRSAFHVLEIELWDQYADGRSVGPRTLPKVRTPLFALAHQRVAYRLLVDALESRERASLHYQQFGSYLHLHAVDTLALTDGDINDLIEQWEAEIPF